MFPCLFDSKKVWFLIKFSSKKGFVFKNSGTAQNRAGKFA
jgi:hypothetical protein